MESNIITTTGLPTNPKYFFSKALRPFSLPVALITCSIGIAVGYQLQAISTVAALLVLLAGVFLQSGVNLINDHADLKNPVSQQSLTPSDITHISFNYKAGWACFIICGLAGLYLTYQTSLFLLILAITGGLGALFYTTEPIHYKRRGLGVILVFFFMGVLMVYGACFAVTGQHHVEAISASIPVSFFTSALLLSNELRDYTNDKAEGLRTLTVILGLSTGKKLYIALISFGFISTCMIPSFKQAWITGLVFVPAFILSIIAMHTATTKANLKDLPPMTGRLYLVFGIGEVLLLIM